MSDEPITITERDLVTALWGVNLDPPDAAQIAAKVMHNLRNQAPLPTWCRAHGALDQCPEHCPIGGGYFHGDSPCSHHPNYGCIQADGKRHGGS